MATSSSATTAVSSIFRTLFIVTTPIIYMTTFHCNTAIVEGKSMQPTFNPENDNDSYHSRSSSSVFSSVLSSFSKSPQNDRILIQKLQYYHQQIPSYSSSASFSFPSLQPGDIVILKHPDTPELLLTKRIKQIGPSYVYIPPHPSTSFEVSRSTSNPSFNHHHRYHYSKYNDHFKYSPGTFVDIPQGYCWVESDEPFVGMDSRHFGPVPLGLVQSKAWAIIYPFHRMKLLS